MINVLQTEDLKKARIINKCEDYQNTGSYLCLLCFVDNLSEKVGFFANKKVAIVKQQSSNLKLKVIALHCHFFFCWRTTKKDWEDENKILMEIKPSIRSNVESLIIRRFKSHQFLLSSFNIEPSGILQSDNKSKVVEELRLIGLSATCSFPSILTRIYFKREFSDILEK